MSSSRKYALTVGGAVMRAIGVEEPGRVKTASWDTLGEVTG